MASDIGVRLGVDGEKAFRDSLGAVNAQLKSLKSEMALVSAQFADTADSEQAFAAKGQVLSRSIETAQAKIEVLTKELARQQSALDSLGEEYEKAISAHGKDSAEALRAQNAYNLQAKAVAGLKGQLNGASADLLTLQRAAREASEQVKETGEEMQDAAGKTGGLGGSIRTLSTALKAAGVGMAVKEIAGVLRDCADASMEFETAIANVNKVAKLSDTELKGLESQIKTLATEIPATTSEIAAVAESAARLGIAKEDLMAFSRVMLDLGNVSDLSADAAATALARFANIAGTSSKDYERLGSTIVALGNNFATSESEITNMASRLASAGTLAGLTEAQIMGLAAAMSSVGIEAEAGGTAMTQTLTAMEKAVSGGGEALEQFASIAGMSVQQFSAAWRDDAAEAVTAFIRGLGQLDGRGESATQVLDELGLSGIRQSNMLKSLALAYKDMDSAMALANQAWTENTELAETAGAKYDTTEASMQMAANAANNLKIAVGDALAPAMEGAAGAAAKLLQGLTNLINSRQGLERKVSEEQINAMWAAEGMENMAAASEDAARKMKRVPESLEETSTAMEETRETAAATIGELESMTVSSEDLSKRLQELSKATDTLTDSADLLSKAQKEQSESGSLSLDTAQKLMDAGYAAAIAIDRETGAITVNAQIYTQLAQAKIDEQIATLRAAQSSVEAQIQLQNEAENAATTAEAYYRVTEAKRELEGQKTDYAAQIAALSRLRESIGSVGTAAVSSSRQTSSAAKQAKTAAEKNLEAYKSISAELKHQLKMDEISQQDYFNALKDYRDQYLTDEENLNTYRQITEEIHSYTKSLAEEEKKTLESMAKDAEKIWKAMDDLETEYQNTLANRAKAIFNSYKLFEEVPEQQRVSGMKLMNNLKNQIASMEEFYSNLEVLEGRGAGAALTAEIRNMGVGAADELKALLSLTDKQLSEYADLYGKKQSLANEIAVNELTQLRKDTDDQIRENLASLEALYASNTPEVGQAFTESLSQSIRDGMPDVIQSAVDVVKKSVQAAMNTLSSESMTKIITSSSDVAAAAASRPAAAEQTANRMTDGIVNGVGALLSGMQGGDLIVPLYVNGREFARATLPDFRAVESSDPKVKDD